MKRHWTPRYVVDRLSVMAYEKRRPDDPWLVRGAVDVIDHLLRPTDTGLEWGSGRSTSWLAPRLGHLTSVEDSPEWASQVSDRIAKDSLEERVSYHLLSTEGDETSPYVRIVERFEDDSLDFCLVDGQLREHCTKAVLPKLKCGSLLVIDNFNWHVPNPDGTRVPYSQTERDGPANEVWGELWETSLSQYRRWWLSSGVTETAVFIKS